MAAEARRRGAAASASWSSSATARRWIWNLASQHFPQATEIVDLYHAREHLHDLAKLLEFMLGGQQAGLARRPARPSLTTATSRRSAPPPAPSPWPAEGQPTSTRPWVTSSTTPTGCATPRFRSLGLFVGSGAVEAGCKAIIGAAPQTVRHATGPSPAPPASSPCAASRPAAGGKKSGSSRSHRSRRSLTRHLKTHHTQTSPGQPQVTRQSPTFVSHTQGVPTVTRTVGGGR